MSTPNSLTRGYFESLDRADPLRDLRAEFDLPEGRIYLDGNSLGARPRATRERLLRLLDQEWGQDLIQSWNTHNWVGLPETVGAAIAPLIGAEADEVIAADSTTVNLYKLISAAQALRPGRHQIVAEAGDFPTNLYVAQGICAANPASRLHIVDPDQIATALGPDTALLMLCHATYLKGEVHDMARFTALAHDCGALMLWDLCHSAGAMPVELNRCAADLAVGCGYKYLNGGPGAPAFLYVARRHQESIPPAICGWMGHGAPFDFSQEYRPAPGLRRMLSGTPSVLGLAALHEGVRLFAGTDMQTVRAKSRRMGELFLELLQPLMRQYGFDLISPADPERRSSQLTVSHPHGYAIVQALIARSVVGDFRPPGGIRFGLAPLYDSYADVWDAVQHLRAVMADEEWRDPGFQIRKAVT